MRRLPKVRCVLEEVEKHLFLHIRESSLACALSHFLSSCDSIQAHARSPRPEAYWLPLRDMQTFGLFFLELVVKLQA
jgi:hypothetical protein